LFSRFDAFPIRFDFLDTIDGGNLSIQCHPNLEYMRKNFGETLTQDETYYILDTKQPSNGNDETSSYVYLGFQPHVDREEFHRALLDSRRQQQPLDVDKYIERVRSNRHDLFLIPNETVHASGKNQLVLEISATPYIYTFKLYDWLRQGLDGRPRPLNIAHGMNNLQFDRHAEQLRCRPTTRHIELGQYEEQYLATHEHHFYDLHRLIIAADSTVDVRRTTDNRFHLCMLVEGDAIELRFNAVDEQQDQEQTRQYNYIETFLIPASIGEYRLRPLVRTSSSCVVLIAHLKWDCERLVE
jgi:mannose-6-phosphate isomerase class I